MIFCLELELDLACSLLLSVCSLFRLANIGQKSISVELPAVSHVTYFYLG